jgi:hypothetical protein
MAKAKEKDDEEVTEETQEAAPPVEIIPDNVATTDDGTESEPPPKARRGHQLLRYVGHADMVTHGEIRFRPGEIVEVTNDVAEELMTLPFEEFEQVTTEAQGDGG